MATATPPAPAPAAAPAQPAKAGKASAPVNAPAGAPGGGKVSAFAGDAALPGVVPDAPDFDAAGRRPEHRIKTHQPPAEGGEGPAETVAEAEAAVDRGVEASGKGFLFNGRTYPSQRAAEQAMVALAGELKAANDRSVTGTTSALSWKAHSEGLQRELDALKAGKGEGATAVADAARDAGVSPQGLEAALNSVLENRENWQIADQIYNEAGPLAAHHFILKEFVKELSKGLTSQMEQSLAPFTEFQRTTGYLQATSGLFSQAAGYVNEAGAPVYPELGNEQAAADVGFIWSRLNLTPQQRVSDEAMRVAISVYRDAVRNGELEAPAGLYDAPAAEPANPAAPAADGARIASDMVDRAVRRAGSPGTLTGSARPVSTARAGAGSEEANLKRGIREAARMVTLPGDKNGPVNMGFLP